MTTEKKPLTPKERRFTLEQLGRLAEIRSAVDCECPNHLAEIVQSLTAFERYSAQCANANDDDAAIHRMLFEETSESRARMEEALQQLVEYEQIKL